jgi:hypothetical protein
MSAPLRRLIGHHPPSENKPVDRGPQSAKPPATRTSSLDTKNTLGRVEALLREHPALVHEID